MNRSLIGFNPLDKITFKKPVINDPDLYKSGVCKSKINKLTSKEKELLITYIKLGYKLSGKRILNDEKASIDSLRTIIEVLYNRKLEIDDILFNPSEQVIAFVESLTKARQTKVWEVLGTYRYNIANTITELSEIRLLKGMSVEVSKNFQK